MWLGLMIAVTISLLIAYIIYYFFGFGSLAFDAARLISTVLVGVGLFWTIIQFHLNRRWDKMEKSAFILNEFKNKILKLRRELLDEYPDMYPYYYGNKSNLTVEDIFNMCEGYKGEGKSLPKISSLIAKLLNEYEFLAFFIKKGLYDDNLIYEFLGGTLLRDYSVFRQYIVYKQQERKDMLLEFDSLAKRYMKMSNTDI